MGEKEIVLLGIGTVIIIGVIVKVAKILSYNKRLTFTMEYKHDFVRLMNNVLDNKGIDSELHSKLVKQVDKMQEELGKDGVLAEMIDPLKQVHCRNYQVLINFMANYTQELMMGGSLMMERVMNHAGLCDNALLRHIGRIENARADTGKSLINPFSCFSEGVRWVISLPVNILYWSGIISYSTRNKYKNNTLKVLIDKFIVLIGLVGSIATLILGWEDLVNIFNNMIK